MNTEEMLAEEPTVVVTIMRKYGPLLLAQVGVHPLSSDGLKLTALLREAALEAITLWEYKFRPVEPPQSEASRLEAELKWEAK